MTKSIVTILDQQITITNHDDCEYFATWDGIEIGYSESLDDLLIDVESYLNQGLQFANDLFGN